jgi:hypothetical protein
MVYPVFVTVRLHRVQTLPYADSSLLVTYERINETKTELRIVQTALRYAVLRVNKRNEMALYEKSD